MNVLLQLFFATLVQGGGQKVEDPRNNESTKLWYSSTSPAWAMSDVQPKDSNIKFVKLAATYIVKDCQWNVLYYVFLLVIMKLGRGSKEKLSYYDHPFKK